MPPPMTPRDIPILIVSTASSSERRITPSWSIAVLKNKLEPITGIPPSAQKLTLRLPERQETSAVEADDEGTVQIDQWPLVPYAELKVRNDLIKWLGNWPSAVTSAHPSASFQLPIDNIPKHEMPISTYEELPDTVLDYKKKHKIGRFDPTAPEKQEQKVKDMWKEVQDGGIKLDARCCLANEPTRRGAIRFIGTIASLPGLHDAPWIGVALDEPSGKNDGSINDERFFHCDKNHGVIVRPEKIHVGDYPELDLEEEDPDMEEI